MNQLTPTFRLGSVVSNTFSIWGKHFLLVAALTALAQIPGWVSFAFFDPETMIDASGEPRFASLLLPLSLTYLGLFVGSLTVMHLVVMVSQGRQPSAGQSLAAGLSRLPHLLAALVLLALMFVIGAILMSLMSIPLAMISQALPGLIIFPVMIWVAMHFFVLVPTLVVERVGPIAALGRSAELMRGAKLKCFALVLLLSLCGVGVALLSFTLLGQLDSWIAAVVQAVIFVALAGLWSVSCAVSYAEVRELKEGVTVDQLAQVFD